ncbi:MAG: FMN-binding negative transcriptional regulator [Pseudomonadales bacterium]
MYTPHEFVLSDWIACEEIMQANSFTQLLTPSEEAGLQISHLPVLYDKRDETLMFHLARANPHCQQLENTSSTVVFSAEHGYISPRWSAQVIVPTWNYRAVHIEGVAVEVTERDQKLAAMRDMSAHYEALQASPWSLDELATETAAAMLKVIRVYKMPIARWCAKAKLSQNKSEAVRHELAEQLSSSSNPYCNLALAALMRAL